MFQSAVQSSGLRQGIAPLVVSPGRHRGRGSHFPCFLERLNSGLQISQEHLGASQEPGRVGVVRRELKSAAEQRQRIWRTLLVEVDRCQHHPGIDAIGSQFHHLLQVIGSELAPALIVMRHGQLVMHVGIVREELGDLRQAASSLLEIAVVERMPWRDPTGARSCGLRPPPDP